MLAGITVTTNTYMVWQTILAILLVISTGVSLYRARKGTNKDEMTYFREEVLRQFTEIKGELDNQTERLEAHIDRSGDRHKGFH